MRSLYFDPFLISAYENLKAGEGTGRHKHKAGEPCHLTIVAAGEVMLTIFEPYGVMVSRHAAPSVIDYGDGANRDHQIKATVDGTTFYNIPRVLRDHRKFVAEELASWGL